MLQHSMKYQLTAYSGTIRGLERRLDGFYPRKPHFMPHWRSLVSVGLMGAIVIMLALALV